MSSLRAAAVVSVMFALANSCDAHAQLKGHYIPGFTGLLVYYAQFKVTTDRGPAGGTLLFDGKEAP